MYFCCCQAGKLKCEKATTNLLNHYYWWISSDCDKKWSSNKILSVAHVARHDSWWASIFWAFVRVLSFGGFIIQLSRSLLSTSQPAGGEPASDSRPHSSRRRRGKRCFQCSFHWAAIRDNLVQARSGSLSAGMIVRSWSETIVPQLHLEWQHWQADVDSLPLVRASKLGWSSCLRGRNTTRGVGKIVLIARRQRKILPEEAIRSSTAG